MEGSPKPTEVLSPFGVLLKDLRRWNRETFSSIIDEDALRGFVTLRSKIKDKINGCPELQREMAKILAANNRKKKPEREPRIDDLRKGLVKEIADRKRKERNLDILVGRKKASLSQKLSQEILVARVRDKFDWLLDCGNLKEFSRQLLELKEILDNS